MFDQGHEINQSLLPKGPPHANVENSDYTVVGIPLTRGIFNIRDGGGQVPYPEERNNEMATMLL